MLELYDWQKEAVEFLKQNGNKNILLTAPTNAGKTLVNYIFLGIFDPKTGKFRNPPQRGIYTVPIKSLANDKFFELSQLGLNVGISTGDVKINHENADIVICTQEVYQDFYKGKGYNVVIDEFHYAFQNSQRALAFVNLSSADRYLLSSATIKVGPELLSYLKEITGREVAHYHTDFRPTKLVFNDVAVDEEIASHLYNEDGKVVLSVAFTRRNLEEVAFTLEELIEDPLSEEKVKRIHKLAEKFGVKLEKFGEAFFKKGIWIYHGKLNYAEKVFIEQLAREKLLRTIISTDAISLGVNFPISDIVFFQLTKFDGKRWRELYPSEFLQISGRAGRKGFFDVGNVWAVNYDLDVDMYNYTFEIFNSLKDSPLEEPRIDIEIPLGEVLEFLKPRMELLEKHKDKLPSWIRVIFAEDWLSYVEYKNGKLSVDFDMEEDIPQLPGEVLQVLEEFTKEASEKLRLSFPERVNFEEDEYILRSLLAGLLAVSERLLEDNLIEDVEFFSKIVKVKELEPTVISSDGDFNLGELHSELEQLRGLYDYLKLFQKEPTAEITEEILDVLNEMLNDPEGQGIVITTAIKLFSKTGLLYKSLSETKEPVINYLLKRLDKEDKILAKLLRKSYGTEVKVETEPGLEN